MTTSTTTAATTIISAINSNNFSGRTFGVKCTFYVSPCSKKGNIVSVDGVEYVQIEAPREEREMPDFSSIDSFLAEDKLTGKYVANFCSLNTPKIANKFDENSTEETLFNSDIEDYMFYTGKSMAQTFNHILSLNPGWKLTTNCGDYQDAYIFVRG